MAGKSKPGPNSAATRREKKDSFIQAYARSGSISAAAKAVDTNRSTIYDWFESDVEFKADCKEAYNEALKAEAVRRALHGDQKLVLYKGKPVMVYEDEAGTVVSGPVPGAKLVPLYETKRSDNLLMFLMKKEDPSYRDRFDVNATAEIKRGDIPQDKSIFDVMREAAKAMGD